jgi:8-oxo-dGTP pyrophosphatase MutT (NUDIX family)
LDNFDKKAVKILNEILEETGAEIVVSSDWRFHATLEELGEYYTSQGIIKKPFAVTGMFKDLFPREWSQLRFRADLELERYMEIQHWIDEHPEITKWVAVDDLNMSVSFLGDRFSSADGSDKKPGLTNFVLTPRVNEGIKQSGIKEKIVHFLQ